MTNRWWQGWWRCVGAWLALNSLWVSGAAEDAVTTPRHTWLRGEQATLTVKLPPEERKGLTAELRGVNVPGKWNVALAEDGTLAVATGQYRVGDYELTLHKGPTTVSTVSLAIRPAEPPEVWFGNFTARPTGYGGDSFGELRDLGMNCAYLYGMGPDEALRRGLYLVHHGNALVVNAGRKAAPEEQKAWDQVYMNCKGVTKPRGMPCMRNPDVIRRAAEGITEEVRALAAYPGFLGIGVDDEVGMRGYDWNDTGGVSCYCASCRQQWKAKTGAEPPTPVALPPGSVVPDADPFLRYATEWTGWGDWYGPGEVGYNQAVAAKLHALRPDLKVFQTPGAAGGELDVVHWEIYSYHFSSPVTEALSAMSLVRAVHQAQFGPPKPIWPLIGWFQFAPAPDWTGTYITSQSRMCLAEGASSIWLTLMYWYNEYGHHADHLLIGAEHLAPSVRELGRLLEQFGPALIRVTPGRYPVGVLHSRTTEIYQRVILPEAIAEAKARGSWLELPWQHGQAITMGFAALLRAGVPAEIITEEAVAAGKLKDYGAVVLLDHKYDRQSIVDLLNAYAAQGGVVLADQGSPIRPKEAKVLPFDAAQVTRMINLGLRAARRSGPQLDLVVERMTGLEREWALLARPPLGAALPPATRVLSSDSPELIVRLGRAGDTDYVYVLSGDVRSEHTGRVSAQVRGKFGYEFFAGDTAALAAVDGVLRAEVTVPAGGWRVYAVTPVPLAGVKLSAKHENGQVTVEAAVQDAQGQPVSGAFPLHLTVLGPKGEALPYGGYFGTDAGKLVRAFRPAINDPTGAWRVQVVNLTTGQAAEATVEVKPQGG